MRAMIQTAITIVIAPLFAIAQICPFQPAVGQLASTVAEQLMNTAILLHARRCQLNRPPVIADVVRCPNPSARPPARPAVIADRHHHIEDIP